MPGLKEKDKIVILACKGIIVDRNGEIPCIR